VQRLETNADTTRGILFLRFDAGADDAQLGKRRRQRYTRRKPCDNGNRACLKRQAIL